MRASSLIACGALAGMLTRQDAANNDWRTAEGSCRWWQARLQASQDADSAAATARVAAELLSGAHQAEPANERILIWLVRAHHLQAQLAMSRNDLESAARYVSAAAALVEPAWQAEQNVRLRLWLGSTRLLQGDLAMAHGDRNAATQAWTTAQELLAEGDAPFPFARLDPLLRALVALGRDAEAAPHRRRLEAAGYVPPQPWPSQRVASAR